MGSRRVGDDERSISRLDRRQFLAIAGGTAGASLAGCLVRGDPSEFEGEISVDGSNTLLPHGAAIAEEFQWRNNRVRVPVRGSGTGAGFERFCTAQTDVQNASRAILDDDEVPEGQISEVRQCADNGVEWIELEAALDGIAVWVHPENTWCDDLTVEELRAIWQSGSDVETWRDVRDDPDWPDEEIDLYGRDAASGTFDYFTKAVNGEIGNVRSDYSASADTNVIVRGVRGNRHAMGWGGAGYYYENEDDLKLLGIDDGTGPVWPDRDTIESGEYTPLSRPMYVYFNTNHFERPELREYARFYFREIDDDADPAVVEEDETLVWTQWAARRVKFYAIPEETVREQQTKLDAILEEYE